MESKKYFLIPTFALIFCSSLAIGGPGHVGSATDGFLQLIPSPENQTVQDFLIEANDPTSSIYHEIQNERRGVVEQKPTMQPLYEKSLVVSYPGILAHFSEMVSSHHSKMDSAEDLEVVEIVIPLNFKESKTGVQILKTLKFVCTRSTSSPTSCARRQ